jgi:hypothetical protein
MVEKYDRKKSHFNEGMIGKFKFFAIFYNMTY